MTFEEKWPDLYKELLKIKETLESHYHDVCNFDFVVEQGRLYIVGMRIAQRTAVANLRFSLQFFQEGKIDLTEALARITLRDVEQVIKPEIVNKSNLHLIGKGIPASHGAASGKIVLSADIADDHSGRGEKVILLRDEVYPEDIGGIIGACGVLTSRGGATSHAAVTCRALGKPCVSGFDLIDIRFSTKEIHITEDRSVREGDWITIDGSDGSVYVGRGKVTLKDWHTVPELVTLLQMVDCAILSGEINPESVGRVWRIRDFLIHSVPFSKRPTRKKPAQGRPFKSVVSPSNDKIEELRNSLTNIPFPEREAYSHILLGLSDFLSRVLAGALGLGNHHLYFRPLWDPKELVQHRGESLRNQFIGFEFFAINHYIPYLVDISDITLLFEIEALSEYEEWFLDFTNPDGESLVGTSDSIIAYSLYVNSAVVMNEDLPFFYNAIRKREYFWKWYKRKKTSHEELMGFLNKPKKERVSNMRLTLLCQELGLLRKQELTDTGLTLVGATSGRKIRSKNI